MKRASRHALSRIFSVSTLGFCLVVLPVPPVLAGQTVNFDSGETDSVIGNLGGTGAWTGGWIGPGNLANSSGNAVNVTGGTVNNDIYGGYHRTDNGDPATANNNRVNIGASFSGNAFLDVYGGYAEVDNDNGLAAGKTAVATGNTVNIAGGMFFDVYGGAAFSYDEASNASNNTVNFTGGTAQNIRGGLAFTGSNTSSTGASAATGNRVFVSGGTVTSSIIGGLSYYAAGTGHATGNTVTISGNPDLTTASLLGGQVYPWATPIPANEDDFTGNTLNLKTSGLTIVNLRNFQYINFAVPAGHNPGTPVLHATGVALLGEDGGSLRSATVTVNSTGASLPAGTRVTLIQADTLLSRNNFTQTTATGKHGVTLYNTWTLATPSADQLIATLNSQQFAPETKALSEGHLAGAILLNRGADMVAGLGMAEAIRAGRANRQGGDKLGFAALSGGSGKYKTGSHVDMNSFSLMAGAAMNRTTARGEANFGAFLEYGNGSYDTYNKFANVGKIEGDGKTRYYGLGALGRMDFAENQSGNYYAEGSLRLGKVKNDVHSGLRDGMGDNANFKTSAIYTSLHLGGGYLLKLNEKSAVNLYGQAFYTREGSDSVTLSTGDPVKFSSVNSTRLRLGGRYEWTMAKVNPYVGLAYEHEFDGKAKATTNGFKIDTPDLKGGSGIAEGGILMKPSPNRPLTLNLGLQGYAGKMEGITGSLRAKYDF